MLRLLATVLIGIALGWASLPATPAPRPLAAGPAPAARMVITDHMPAAVKPVAQTIATPQACASGQCAAPPKSAAAIGNCNSNACGRREQRWRPRLVRRWR